MSSIEHSNLMHIESLFSRADSKNSTLKSRMGTHAVGKIKHLNLTDQTRNYRNLKPGQNVFINSKEHITWSNYFKCPIDQIHPVIKGIVKFKEIMQGYYAHMHSVPNCLSTCEVYAKKIFFFVFF